MVRKSLLPLVMLFPVFAASAAQPGYRVGLATPVTATMIVKDARWVCAGDECRAPRTGAMPDVHACTAIVRKLGPVTSFNAGGRDFDADEIAKCNAAAQR